MITKETLSKEGSVTISAASLMYIANVLREHQISVMSLLADHLSEGGDDDLAERISGEMSACMIVGQKVMDCIEQLVGNEVLDSFIEGKLSEIFVDTPTFTAPTDTLN